MGYKERNLTLICYIDFPQEVLERTEDSTYAVNIKEVNKITKKTLENKSCFISEGSKQFIKSK